MPYLDAKRFFFKIYPQHLVLPEMSGCQNWYLELHASVCVHEKEKHLGVLSCHLERTKTLKKYSPRNSSG